MIRQKWFIPSAGLDRDHPALVVGGQIRLDCRQIAGGKTTVDGDCHKAGFASYGDMSGELVTLTSKSYVGSSSDDWDVEFSCGITKRFSTQFFVEAHLPYLHVGGQFLFRPIEEQWDDGISEWMQVLVGHQPRLLTFGECDGLKGRIVTRLEHGTQNRRIWQAIFDGSTTIASWYDTWMEPIGAGGKVPSRCRCDLWIGACHCGGAREELDEEMAAQGKVYCRWARMYVKKR